MVENELNIWDTAVTFSRVATLMSGEQALPPTPPDSATADDLQGFNEETLAFFEKNYLLATDACNEFSHCVKGQSAGELNSSGGGAEESGYAQVDAQMKNILYKFGYRIFNSTIPDVKTKILDWFSHELQVVRETGTPSPQFKNCLKMRSPDDQREDVTNWTWLSEIVRSCLDKLHPFKYQQTSSATPKTTSVSKTSLPNADTLFSHLSETLCSFCKVNDRRALLQLSGWSQPQNQAMFRIFLPCCPAQEDSSRIQEYHSTLCKVDIMRLSPNRTPMDLCHEIQTSRDDEMELRLAFSRSHLWAASPPQEFLPSPPPRRMNLQDLLKTLKTSSGDSGDEIVKRSRLAFKLASSLHYLCLGPWVQDNWTLANICILGDANGRPLSEWDDSYVLCTFGPGVASSSYIAESFKNSCPEYKPAFFTSFAQLLLYIVKGELDFSDHASQDPKTLAASLRGEVRNFKGTPMESYGEAVAACLVYSKFLRVKMSTKVADTEECVRQVIRENIVLPLQRNLETWNTSCFSNSDKSSDTEPGWPSDPFAPRPSIRTQTRRDNRKTDRDPILSEYQLFSVEEGQSSAWMDGMQESEGDFTHQLKQFLASYINPLEEQCPGKKAHKRVRVAILDTGFYSGSDVRLQDAMDDKRIILQQNFTGDSKDCTDHHGHGTHVARLVLEFAPQADVLIAKISDSKSLAETKIDQLIEALKWAGRHADIINLSFGLGLTPPLTAKGCDLAAELDCLILQGKLIFAAASNFGRNLSRSWPASHNGVFCIHATNEQGEINTRINPIPGDQDNFAALGDKVRSRWAGKDVCISGTSFATPIAAAIAANVLEYARRNFSDANPDLFLSYGKMRSLFRDYMCDNGKSSGHYHYLRPWREGLWAPGVDEEALVKKLEHIAVGSKERKRPYVRRDPPIEVGK